MLGIVRVRFVQRLYTALAVGSCIVYLHTSYPCCTLLASGECILEWEGKGEPDKPVLKDKFAAERRKVGFFRMMPGPDVRILKIALDN